MRKLAIYFLLAGLPAAAAAQTPFTGYYPLIDSGVIRYETTPPNDAVARFQRRLDRGEAKLTFEQRQGYLLSVLRQFNIPVSSQTLVFSKTSSQQPLIGPATPRALYFNDDIYVGWVPGGSVMEVAATDPSQGTMFYTLDQREAAEPKFVRRQECLECHASTKTVGVPGLLLRSVFPAADGSPRVQMGSFDTTQSSPLKERWGGWYVTGTSGGQHHMGSSIEGRHSDIVALMILAHQTRLHNLISRVNWETRLAMHDRGASPEAVSARIRNGVEILLRSLLFTDETRLEGPVRGTSGFAGEFEALGPKDKGGRSLRDLDMNSRMFLYPCSYLIYSESFDALPKPTLDYLYRRLWEVLTSKDTSAVFAGLGRSDRESILNILRDTKAGLPDYWRP